MRHTSWVVKPDVRRLRAAVVALEAIGILGGGGLRPASGQAAGPGTTGGACRIVSIDRDELRSANGDRLYVEPSSLTASGDDLLLAGTPNYILRFAPGSTLPSEVVTNGILGVILRRDGSVVPVPAPRDATRIAGIRTAARAAGGWHVVFSEAERLNADGFPFPGVRMWYGVLEGSTWRRLEALPLPEGHEVSPLSISSLVSMDDSLAVAAIVEPTGSRRAVALFTRGAGGWKGSAAPHNAAYVESVWPRGQEPLVAVVKGDETRQNDVNSLLLYAVRPDWRRVRRVAGGTGAPVHAPGFQPAGAGYLSGLVGREHEMGDRNEATLWPLDEGQAPRILDTSAARLATHAIPGSGLVAVVEHLMDDDVSRELRLYQSGADGVRLIEALRYPFAGYSASAFLPPDELVIAGPHVMTFGVGEMVVGRLLRVKLNCGPP